MSAHPDHARAAMAAVLFGVALYAGFTFLWTPIHYIHLMLVTLFTCVGVGLGVNRFLLSRRASLGLFRRDNSTIPGEEASAA